MFSMRDRLRKTATLFTFCLIAGLSLCVVKATGEIDGPDIDGPLRAFVKRRIDPPAWMYGFTEAECTEYGVRYGCWEIYVKFDNHKIPDDGAVSGQIVYECLDEPKHGGSKEVTLNRIKVDSYIYGYEVDVGQNRWASAWLDGNS